jgi:hypothetical protein
MRRCHPSSVSSATTKIDHRRLGRRRLSAASSARSWGWSWSRRVLVAQDQDLYLFRIRRLPAEHHQRKDAAKRQVDERPDH